VRVLLSLLFLLSLFVPPLECRGADPASSHQKFLELTRKEVAKATRKRDGIVIWMDRHDGQTLFFGNERLKDEKFPPGSLMKLITAQAAVKKRESLDYTCAGHDEIGGKRVACWTYKGHGKVDLPKALALSCNLYFMKLVMGLGWESLASILAIYDLSPPSPLRERAGVRGGLDDDLSRLAIGDSPSLQVTPLQMIQLWNQYMNFLQDPRASGIRQGLLRAVTEGTASRAGVSGLEIMGKTGTSDSLRTSFKTDGWFLGATPSDSPRFLLLVFLREAHGFDEPARLAGKIFLLAKKWGVVEEIGDRR